MIKLSRATVRKHMPATSACASTSCISWRRSHAPLVGDLKKSRHARPPAKAVAPLGEDYQKDVQKAYNEGWIDVYPNRGKRGGAYPAAAMTPTPISC